MLLETLPDADAAPTAAGACSFSSSPVWDWVEVRSTLGTGSKGSSSVASEDVQPYV